MKRKGEEKPTLRETTNLANVCAVEKAREIPFHLEDKKVGGLESCNRDKENTETRIAKEGRETGIRDEGTKR